MDIGYILANMPPIVENIFKYLNKPELDSCSEVCDLWMRVAETEKKRREDIAWFFQGLECTFHKKIHSNPCKFSADNDKHIESDLSKQFRELKMKPEFCLTFATSYLIDDFELHFPSFVYPPTVKAKRLKLEDLLRERSYIEAAIQTSVGQYLPKKCETVFFVASGIIGSQKDSLPFELERSKGISGFMIPRVPGLQIFTFPVTKTECDISKLLAKETEVKCLLAFSTLDGHTHVSKIIDSCLLKENSNIAVGGAIISQPESRFGTIIAFCGRSVEAATIIIKANETEKAIIEEKLKLFEETGLLKDRCFAFMFTCVARGYFTYREFNVESSIFHKLYPHVPLIGVCSIGEVGVEFLPNMPSQNQNKEYFVNFSTTFVLVSLKL